MDLSWSEEQRKLKCDIIEFAQRELNANLIERNQGGAFSRENWNKCAEYGILGLAMPEVYGGRGYDVMTSMLLMEGLGYGCRDNGLVLGLNAQMWTTQMGLLHFGTEFQKDRFLPGLCRGDIIGAGAMTELEAGSDVYSLKTQAEKNADGYMLNGAKIYVTLGPVADVVIVYATLDPARGRWGLTAFLVETQSPGCRVSPTRDKMGLRTLPLGDIVLEDCFVPETHRLGPENSGANVGNVCLEWERSCMLACQLGSMERQLEQALRHSRQRRQFGQTIRKFQSVSNRIADMKLRLESARWLIYHAGWLKQNNQRATLDTALAKLSLTEGFLQSGLDAIRIHGGQGYLEEFEIERDLRDAVGGVIYGGTSDIQRNIIAQLIGL